MASTHYLGTHTPSALEHLVAESILPPNPSADAYSWLAYNDQPGLVEELIVTQSCVVWSQGTVVRRLFRFDHEPHKVTQALLTWFPHGQPRSPAQGKGGRSLSSRSRALVVVFKTQAHVYFLHGSAHIVTLNFEIDCAFPLPTGVIFQRKLSELDHASMSPDLPTVPPNSFWSSQNQPWIPPATRNYMAEAQRRSSQSKKFKEPRSLSDLKIPQATSDKANLPRHFVLTDPMSEIDLVVEASKSPHSSETLFPLDENEGLIYVSSGNELGQGAIRGDPSLILVLTLNRQRMLYTLWHALYSDDVPLSSRKKDLQKKEVTFTRAKRRSSYATRLSTGATTPVMRNHESFKSNGDARLGQSFNASQNNRTRLSESQTLAGDDDDEFGLPSQEDISFVGPRRQKIKNDSNRRTSSMLARAELSSQEQLPFAELAKAQPGLRSGGAGLGRRRPSSGPGNERTSLGKSRQSARASSPGNLSLLSDVEESSQLDFGDPDTVEELIATGRFNLEDEINLSLTRRWRQRLLLIKTSTIPCNDKPSLAGDRSLPTWKDSMKVRLISKQHSTENQAPSTTIVSLFMSNREAKEAVEIAFECFTLPCRTQDESRHPEHDRKVQEIIVPSRKICLRRYEGFTDLEKVVDSGTQRIIGLEQGQDHSRLVFLASNFSASQPPGFPFPPKVINGQDALELRCESAASVSDFLGEHRSLFSLLSVDKPLSNEPQMLHHSTGLGITRFRDSGNQFHQFQINLRPKIGFVSKALRLCSLASDYNLIAHENALSVWQKLLSMQGSDAIASEWKALVSTIFYMVLQFKGFTQHLQKTRQGRDSSGDQISETPNPSTTTQDGPWEWIRNAGSASPTSLDSFLLDCFGLAKTLMGVGVPSNQASLNTTKAHASDLFDQRRLNVQRLILALHLFWEEQKLNMSPPAESLNIGLSPVLAQIGQWLDWGSWSWKSRENIDRTARTFKSFAFDDHILEGIAIPQPCDPPSIILWLGRAVRNGHIDDYPLLDNVLAVKTRSAAPKDRLENQHMDAGVAAVFTPRTKALKAFFETSLSQTKNAVTLVEDMQRYGIDMNFLETLPEFVAASLRGCLVTAQTGPPTTWPEELLVMVSRQDLQFLLEQVLQDEHVGSSMTGTVDHMPRSMKAICHHEGKSSNAQSSGGRESEQLVNSIFRVDRRWQEAQKLVNPLKIAIAEIFPKNGATESEFLESQKQLAQLVYQRTMALPAGQGVLNFASSSPVLTEKITVPSFNTTCNMQPSNNSVSADRSNFTEEKVGWAFFHSGVNAGLRIASNARGIDTTWLVLNKPSDLGNRHAGLLLALGLNGHLRKMAKWLAFKYLTPKHTMTSVGLLLGLSASNLGSMDSLVTRLLSVHVTRLLPQGAAELNLSPLTQTAGIMGVGLLYYNSQHRRMSEVMLSEIEHMDEEEPASGHESFRDEAYRLAAGFALGFINLGRGSDPRALHDLRITERLLSLATGPREIKSVHVMDQATAGAVIAFALVFMRTNDNALAERIDVPDIPQQFEYIRPDILLLRTVAKFLIRFDDIEPSLEWVKNNIPTSFLSKFDAVPPNTFASDSLPLYNILSGLCLVLSLKYAGTHNRDALFTLQHHWVRVRMILKNTVLSASPSFEFQLARDMLLRYQHILGVAMAIVAAGSGSVSVLALLRSMHADVNKSFGHHQATHQAIGLLFLGQGRYSLSRSNLAIASLLAAFYPLVPRDVLDNKAHLQALRHLWVFAAEPRCLIPRDIETRLPVTAPIEIQLREKGPNGADTEQDEAPVLLPELQSIARVTVKDPHYWTVVLDFERNPAHLAAFRRHQTVFLRRKPLMAQHGGSVLGASLATLEAVSRASGGFGGRSGVDAFEGLFELRGMKDLGLGLDVAGDVLGVGVGGGAGGAAGRSEDPAPVQTLLDTRTTAVDDYLALRADALTGGFDAVVGLRALLGWAVRMRAQRGDGRARLGLGEGAREAGGERRMEWLRGEWLGILRAVLVERRMRALKVGDAGVGRREEDWMVVD